MKIGLFLATYHDRPLADALEAARAAGVEAVEISTSGPHAPDRAAVEAHGLEISALSCHANPLHPDESVAAAADRSFRDTVRLAADLGVRTVVTFAGCPGESEHSLRPCWVVNNWPDDFAETLAWQWRERVIPYWTEAAAFAADHGVRVALEPHAGFVVHNTATMLRLREAAGDNVGANFDPSHLFWQQIDPVASARALAGAVFHVHAKDTTFQERVLAVDGVLETRREPDERAWVFVSVGDGHPVELWRDLVGALRDGRYDGALSIEPEDPYRSREDGIARGVETLRAALA